MLLLLSLLTLLLHCQHRRHRHRRRPAWRLTPATQTPSAAPPRCRELSYGKNQEKKYNMASSGRQTQIKTQQPTKNTQARWGRDETWGATSGEHGGRTIWSFLGDQVGLLCKKLNYNQCFYLLIYFWVNLQNKIKSFVSATNPLQRSCRKRLAINTIAMPLDQANGSTMVMFFFRVGSWCAPFL